MADRTSRSGTEAGLAAFRRAWGPGVIGAFGRILKWVSTLGIIGVAAATVVGAWRFSDLLYEDALLPPDGTDLPPFVDGSVVASTATEITLRTTAGGHGGVAHPGVFGLLWEGGHGRMGEVIGTEDGEVTRVFTPVESFPGVGDDVAVDEVMFYGDPAADLGVDFTEVEIETELGPAPAWFVSGDSTTWVIFTHGKGMDRREALRALPSAVAAGLPALVITYRNDVEALPDPSGIYQFGLTEWRDLQSAVEWALEHGADRVVLAGYSMGGGITMQFMHASAFSDRVTGLVLDAPMLDLSRTVDQGASSQGVPALLTALAKTVAAARFGLSWSELDYLAKLDKVDVPILAFHGAADERVPIALSVDLARALPDQVEFVRVAGAGHVESYNVAAEAYSQALVEFLTAVAPPTG